MSDYLFQIALERIALSTAIWSQKTGEKRDGMQ